MMCSSSSSSGCSPSRSSLPHGIAFKAMPLEDRLVRNKVLGKEQNEVIIHSLTFDEVKWVMCSTLQRDGSMLLVCNLVAHPMTRTLLP